MQVSRLLKGYSTLGCRTGNPSSNLRVQLCALSIHFICTVNGPFLPFHPPYVSVAQSQVSIVAVGKHLCSVNMSNQRMIVSFPSLFSLILFLSSGIPSSQVDAQACFYPNGSPSKQDDRPCSSEPGSACCPLNWQCLSNGLCFLENEGYYGRYTCTDPSWESDGCPQLCTQGMCSIWDFPSLWLGLRG